MKASKKLNLFSNISHYMRGDIEKQALQKQLEDMKKQQQIDKQSYEIELDQVKSVLNKLVENERLKSKTISL